MLPALNAMEKEGRMLVQYWLNGWRVPTVKELERSAVAVHKASYIEQNLEALLG